MPLVRRRPRPSVPAETAHWLAAESHALIVLSDVHNGGSVLVLVSVGKTRNATAEPSVLDLGPWGRVHIPLHDPTRYRWRSAPRSIVRHTRFSTCQNSSASQERINISGPIRSPAALYRSLYVRTIIGDPITASL